MGFESAFSVLGVGSVYLKFLRGLFFLREIFLVKFFFFFLGGEGCGGTLLIFV